MTKAWINLSLIVFVLGLADVAWALTCSGGIVSLGESTAEVNIKCGDPTIWEQRTEESNVRDGDGRWFHQTRTIDEWIYDFGPHRFVQTLIFQDGNLVKISSGDYGKGQSSSKSDRIGIINLGNSKAQVILKWGEPTYSEQHPVERSIFGSQGEVLQQTVTVERLTYDFGPNRLIRILTFENGKLVGNRTAGYGKNRAKEVGVD
jgi:hypothetical protein